MWTFQYRKMDKIHILWLVLFFGCQILHTTNAICTANSDVVCLHTNTKSACRINNNTGLVHESLQNCTLRETLSVTVGSEVRDEVNIDLSTILLRTSLVQLDITVEENATLYLDTESASLYLIVLTISGEGTIRLPNNDLNGRAKKPFFQYFENVSTLVLIARFEFSSSPSFTGLRNLATLIIVVLPGENSDSGFGGVTSLGSNVVNDLGSLELFSWTGGSIETITADAFEGTNRIRTLALSNNRIRTIEAKAFDGLTEVEDINLSNNIVQQVTPPVFYASTNLFTLTLSNNPFFPLEALAGTHATQIILDNNGYETLRAVDFLAIAARPVTISLTELLSCDCSLQWTSGVTQFGITFNNALCKDPESSIGREIQEASYIECSDTDETFECSGIETECPTGQSCIIESGGSHCGCITGYTYNTGALSCEDIDECESKNDNTCEYECSNTIGSFYCSCKAGYQTSASETECVDVNECLVRNGGCGYACINTEGGHECVCENGAIVEETGDCQPMSIIMSPLFSWGLAVSITLFILIAMMGVCVSVYLVHGCYKGIKKRKVIGKDDQNATNQVETGVYENGDLAPDFEPYAVVVRNEGAELDSRAHSINSERDKYYVI